MNKAVTEVAELVKSAGGRALLVGGCVRDRLLMERKGFRFSSCSDGDNNWGCGIPSAPKDFDIEVYGLSPETLQKTLATKFDLDLVGVSFGVIKLHGHDIDVALPRRETKLGEGHRAFEMEYDSNLPIEEASARRDFTINAIYMDPLTKEIIDPWNGRADLAQGILRHVSEHFREDPLRVLRGMQFVARFDLSAAPETVEVCRSMTPEGLAQERLMGEWSKLLLQGKQISKGLNFLRDVGWVKYYPELEALIGCEQDPEWHPEGDVWNHTLCCLDAFAAERQAGSEEREPKARSEECGVRSGGSLKSLSSFTPTSTLLLPHSHGEDLIVGLAVLCHDFGKPACTKFDPVKQRIRSLGHDEEGVAPTLSFLRRLTNEERLFKEVPPLVRMHMRPFAMWRDKSSDGAIRRLAAKVVRIDRLCRVAAADDAGRPPFPCDPTSYRWLAEQAKRLEVEAAAPKPIVMGRHLVELGMKPGPDFKRILDQCFEAQLDGAFSDLSSGISYLKSQISDRRS